MQNGALAQLVARYIRIVEVTGSNPAGITIKMSDNVKFSDIFYIIESLVWFQKAVFDNKKGAFPSDFR